MKYLLPVPFSGPTFFINQLSDSLKTRKILSDWNRIHKPRVQIFWIFKDFMKLSGLHPTHTNISYGYPNLEIVYLVPLYISISCMSRVFEPAPSSFNSGSLRKLVNYDISNTWKSHTGKNLLKKLSNERLHLQNSVRAEVEEYRKSKKVKLWIANCAIFYNLYKERFFDWSFDHK